MTACGNGQPVERPRNGVVVVGDSLAVATDRYLPAEVFDAALGRPLAAGMDVIRAQDLSDKVLAVSLFTNDDPAHVDELEAAVRETVALSRCAVWATIARPALNGVGYERANARLHALRRELRPRLKIVRWAELVETDPSLLGHDGIHAIGNGYRARAALYRSAIDSCDARR